MGSEIVNCEFVQIRNSLFKADDLSLEWDISWHVNFLYLNSNLILIWDQIQMLLELGIIDPGLLV